ncbi:MAG: pyridoxamine 5'-phosphate oxidase family protein [Geobacter sp.]|nr:pyridoxamine 5'-phosphate oxidase family protein [Geobacter sp.]
MRKQNKRITDADVIIDLLKSCHVGRLGTMGSDGWPMVKPLNFAWHEGSIYFHCALEGEKLEDIRRDSRVCFEVDLPIAYVKGTAENPCRAEYLYRSVILRGRDSLVESRAEKVLALNALMHKYQPEGEWRDYPEEKLDITGIVRIDIEDMCGKEELGKGEMQAQALRILNSGEVLPVVIG